MSSTTTTTRHLVTDSPLGALTLVRDDDGLAREQYLLELEKAIPVAPQPLW